MKLCALVLCLCFALAGCHSQNPSAGSDSSAASASASPLVGIWKLSNRPGIENRTYNADGTASIFLNMGTKSPGMTIAGTYTQPSPDTIQFFYQGKPTTKETVKIEGDTLKVLISGNWLEFKRAAP